jgi:NADH-quinone oxidoreductase subunit L/NAD(P)H-quinone oxidoreductase subunit 5
VNGGGVLLVRTGGLVGQSTMAMAVTAIAGGLTMLYGSAAMLTKPDVKGALVHSTRAQMGFMILTCGLGLYGAAVFHLIAHGMYKATLFLNSGSALSRRERAERRAPTPPTSPARSLLSTTGAMALSGLAAAFAVAIVPGAVHSDGVVLLVFGWVTAAVLIAGWLRRRPGVRVTALVTATLTAVAVGYLIAVAGLTGFVADGLPSAKHMPTVWPVAAVITALAVLLTIRLLPVGGRGDRLHHSAYAAALNAGYVGTAKGAF